MDMSLLKSDLFSMATMTKALDDLPHVPGRIEALKLFETQAIATTEVAVERRNGLLVLVPPSPRGAPGTALPPNPRRDLRTIAVPHFEINDAVYADSVQDVRAFGTTNELQSVTVAVSLRMREAKNSLCATEELARIGAVKGLVTYADSSSLDMFTEFGVTQLAEVDFDLDNATPAGGALRRTCASVIRAVTDELGGLPATGFRAFCGDNFFDDLLAHPEVRETYQGWGEARILRESYLGKDRSETYGIFEFGGIVWENYRGNVGGTAFVNTDKVHIFPMGVPGLFRTAYAPADYVDTVNRPGVRHHVRATPSENGKLIRLDFQHNALQYCTRPRVLVKGKRT